MEEEVQLANRLVGLQIADRVGSEHVERWIKIINDTYGGQDMMQNHRIQSTC